MPPMNMAPLPDPIALAMFYRLILEIGAAAALATALGYLWLRRHRQAPAESLPPLAERVSWALGALWLLDGLLQMQPLMVTHFIGGFLSPLLDGEPSWLQAIVRVGIDLWSINPIVWNALAAWLQAGIGVALLFSRRPAIRRTALWVSIGWSAMVWLAGEAMGGVFAGGSWLSGSPGSVLLYGLLAGALLWEEGWQDGRLSPYFRWGLAAYFGLAAVLQAWPASGFWGTSLAKFVQSMAEMPQPAVLSAPLYAWAAALTAHPAIWNGAIASVAAALCLLWAVRPHRPVTFWASVATALAVWYFGQDFGVLGGMGTDPNTGAPLLVGLLAYPALAGLRLRVGASQTTVPTPRMTP